MGSYEILLVPVGPDGKGMVDQALFVGLQVNSQPPTPNSQREPFDRWGRRRTSQLVLAAFTEMFRATLLGSWELAVGSWRPSTP